MKKKERTSYIFQKKSLLILLFLFYINDVDYSSLTLRSFGFSFDPTCNFKVIIKSKKDHIHKYVVHIFSSLNGVNLESLDVMGNVNIIKVRNVKNVEVYYPSSSLNIYFDESTFLAEGQIEGKYISYRLNKDKSSTFKDELLTYLEAENVNSSSPSFKLWLLRLYTSKIHVDLVMGAGINCDYGAKDWKGLIDDLNFEFYKGNKETISEIKHYVGQELFVTGKVLNSGGFDTYKSLDKELYLFKEAKSFSDSSSTLYKCVDYIEKHKGTSVITYNYDTNLEYLLKKRGLRYCTVYDDGSFITNDSIVDIYHVHGLLPYEKYDEDRFRDSLIFNESEYFYLYNNPYSWNISKQLHDFKFNECIFIGISLTDPNMKRLLELASNYFKFNFIFMKREKGFSEKTFIDVTNYFFTYDLITIWIDEYEEIGSYLEMI